MSRRNVVINAILAIVLVAYIVVMIPMTNRAERNDTFTKLTVRINDLDTTRFLKNTDVYLMLGDITDGFDTLKRKNLNTFQVENILNSNSRIESSTCRILNDGTLFIDVDPIDPVARIFDSKGSVYVNAEGKRVKAMPSYHVDVPVVTTNSVADSAMVRYLLPILRAIKTNPRANALVSSLRIDSKGDIIIIPNIVGHVINFGDTTLIDNKLDRLQVFYRKVMPVRGWNAFDTISLKWNGRVVATKRDKTQASHLDREAILAAVDETLDDEVMLSTN